jgi:hypothetical protein
MNLLEPLVELLIFARERGAEELPEVEMACRAAERKIEELRTKRRRRESRNAKNHCVVCDARTKEMLCWSCKEHAPEEIRNAFLNASGLDGMRAAVEKIKAYAASKNGVGKKRRAA